MLRLSSLLAALMFAASPALAQHPTDVWVGQNSQGQIATTGVIDLSTPVLLQPTTLLGGWAFNDPGFDSVVTPVNGVMPAPSNAVVHFNLTSAAPGLEVISDALVPLQPGDSAALGPAGFHVHFTWHVHGPDHPEFDALRAHWDCVCHLTDASGTMAPSAAIRIVFQTVEADLADVDQDGMLSPADHLAFLQVLANPAAASAAERASADVDLDGYVTAADECPLLARLGLGGFVRGDTNSDLTVNLADAVALLGFLFGGASPPSPMAAGDVNADGDVNVADAVYVLSYLFQGGTAPSAPFPDPGC
ncbi:MAG: dockerin type I repeat-containing protein [Planctomycetota bacterium]